MHTSVHPTPHLGLLWQKQQIFVGSCSFEGTPLALQLRHITWTQFKNESLGIYRAKQPCPHITNCFTTSKTEWIIYVFTFLSEFSWISDSRTSNQESYPHCRPVNCKTVPRRPGGVPNVAPGNLSSGQVYRAVSWLTRYTISESHLAQGLHHQVWGNTKYKPTTYATHIHIYISI